jgi:hypothetical protein
MLNMTRPPILSLKKIRRMTGMTNKPRQLKNDAFADEVYRIPSVAQM